MTTARRVQWVGVLFMALALVLAFPISFIAVLAVALAVFGTIAWSVGIAAAEVEKSGRSKT